MGNYMPTNLITQIFYFQPFSSQSDVQISSKGPTTIPSALAADCQNNRFSVFQSSTSIHSINKLSKTLYIWTTELQSKFQLIENCTPRFLKNIFYNDAITVAPFFSPLNSPSSLRPSPTSIPPPQFMSMGRTCKFFGFSTSYTILNLPLSTLCQPFMFLIPLYLSF